MLLIPSAGIWSELSKWRRFDILQDNKDLGTLKLYKYGRQDMTMPWHRGGLTCDKTTMRDGTQDREEDGASVTCVKNCPEMRGDTTSQSKSDHNCWLRKSERFHGVCPPSLAPTGVQGVMSHNLSLSINSAGFISSVQKVNASRLKVNYGRSRCHKLVTNVF